MFLLAVDRLNARQAEVLEHDERIRSFGLDVSEADSSQGRQRLGSFLRPDRRTDAHGGVCVRSCLSLSRPVIVTPPRPARLKFSTKSRSSVGRRVVDQRHQVGDVHA